MTVCQKYNEAITNQEPPHLIFDTTISGLASETIKSVTSALSLPTISASFGQSGDLRQWRDLTTDKSRYLLQVMFSFYKIEQQHIPKIYVPI